MSGEVVRTVDPPLPGNRGELPPVVEATGDLAPRWAELLRHGFSATQQLGAFATSVLLLVAILALLGYEPGRIVDAIWNGAFGSTTALERSFNQAAPMVLTGTAVWLAYQCGLFNIGADGQLQVGGIATVAVLTAMPSDAPSFVLVAVGLLVAALAGAAWSSIAGILRVWRGASEVIATIMLNFIAFRLVDAMISGPLRSSTARFTPQSERVPPGAELGGISGSSLTTALVVALVAGLAVVLVVQRTTIGLRLRGIGLNEHAAAHAAIPVGAFRLAAFTASGALAGLAGGVAILGLRFMLAPGWAPPWGFSGILIAFLALRTPLLIPLWGVVFGMLASAGPALKAQASVPDAIVTVTQTLPVIVLFVFFAVGRWWRRRGRRAPVGEAGGV